MTTLLRNSRSYQQLLIVMIMIGSTIPALVAAVGVRRITRPIEALTSAAQEVAHGQFDHAIPSEMGGEVGELAKQFNLMAAELQASYSQLEQRVADRTRELATLYAIAMVVSQSMELEETLSGVLEQVLSAFAFEAGAVYLKESQRGTIHLACQSGDFSPFALPAVQQFLTERTLASGTPLIVNDLRYRPLAPTVLLQAGCRTLASIPLLSKGEAAGVLTIVRRYRPHHFSPQDVELCLSIGNQIGVAIESARLAQRAQQLAVLEERQRLARELHDSVTQALYSLTLFAEAGRRQAATGEWERVESYLDRLADTAQQALKEMRLLVYELRPPTLEHDGLVGALQKRLAAVEKRAGMDARLLVEGEFHDLPAPIEEGLYRIAQEAFNNALKHAAASEIRVQLHADDVAVVLEVADNGHGFDVGTGSVSGGLGLTSMQERAERLNGRLTILSEKGSGTIVRVRIARLREVEESRDVRSTVPVAASPPPH